MSIKYFILVVDKYYIGTYFNKVLYIPLYGYKL